MLYFGITCLVYNLFRREKKMMIIIFFENLQQHHKHTKKKTPHKNVIHTEHCKYYIIKFLLTYSHLQKEIRKYGKKERERASYLLKSWIIYFCSGLFFKVVTFPEIMILRVQLKIKQ